MQSHQGPGIGSKGGKAETCLLLEHLLTRCHGLLFGLADGQGGLAFLQLPSQPVNVPLLVAFYPDQVVSVLLVMLGSLCFACITLPWKAHALCALTL